MNQQVFKQPKIMRSRKMLRKMSVRLNVRMSKIMRTLIKVGVLMYATYTNYPTLYRFGDFITTLNSTNMLENDFLNKYEVLIMNCLCF